MGLLPGLLSKHCHNPDQLLGGSFTSASAQPRGELEPWEDLGLEAQDLSEGWGRSGGWGVRA